MPNQNSLPHEEVKSVGCPDPHLLIEYPKAQDSAQHHDTLLWRITGIIWGASMVLLGFVASNLTKPGLKPLIAVLGVFGPVLSICVWLVAWMLNSVKNQKYRRCKEIERLFHFTQHSSLRYPARTGLVLYSVIMLLFLFVWILVVWMTLVRS